QRRQSLRRPVDPVVCSVLDMDRGVPLQAMLAAAYGAELAAGVDLVAKAAGATRAWVVADAAASLEFQYELRKGIERGGAKVVPLRNDYPQGHPTMLLYTVLRRR